MCDCSREYNQIIYSRECNRMICKQRGGVHTYHYQTYFSPQVDQGRYRIHGHTAIVEAIGPELGNRIQRIRVELPAITPELIPKLRKADVDIDAHPVSENSPTWGILGNLIFPIVLIGGVAFLFRRSGNMPGGPGNLNPT